MMPALVECSDSYASLGEMCDVLRAVWGVYRETPVSENWFQESRSSSGARSEPLPRSPWARSAV